MSIRTKKHEKKLCDVVFIIDSTESTYSVGCALHDKAEDLAFGMSVSERSTLFKYACICYRDPVDCESDVHQVFDFDEDIENLDTFLGDVEPSGGGDGPEDFVGALNAALNDLSWRNGRKIIIWFADGPAHGPRFCGLPNHPEEEPKLVSLVEKIAKNGIEFYGLYLGNERTKRTFSEMEKIYRENSPFSKQGFFFENCESENMETSFTEVFFPSKNDDDDIFISEAIYE